MGSVGGPPGMGMKLGGMCEYHDVRVTYGKEPWNNPLKAATGLSAIPPDHKWRRKLIAIYTAILDESRMIPEHCIYRQVLENIYREFLRIVTNVGDTDWHIVERKIGLGQVENLIMFAMDERELVQQYAEWKLWLIPVETMKEAQAERSHEMFWGFAGPPEPYLSDEEINDIKKIDQQRMAEEQKMLAQDVKKLTGRSSRMIMEGMEERTKKREEYDAAVAQYIRETQLDRSYELRADGSVRSIPNQNTVIEDGWGQSTPNMGANYDRGAGRHEAIPGHSTFDMDARRRVDAFVDPDETSYVGQKGRKGIKTQNTYGMHMMEANPIQSSYMDWNRPIEDNVGMRLQLWEAKDAGLIDDVPLDPPRGGAAAAKEARGTGKGRLIPKWKKPSDVLGGTEVPVSPAKRGRPLIAEERLKGIRLYKDEASYDDRKD